MTASLDQLPEGLVAPTDDGGAAHLTPGLPMPSVSLPATDGANVDFSAVPGLAVIYAYPMTGRPDTPLPEGWDEIPGARGCTPQSCSFRDHLSDLQAQGADHVFGLSTQSTDWQKEAAERLHLPFLLVSDAGLALAKALNMPTFSVEGMTLYRRITLIICDGAIETVFYPVFPPNESAQVVLDYLTHRSESPAKP